MHKPCTYVKYTVIKQVTHMRTQHKFYYMSAFIFVWKHVLKKPSSLEVGCDFEWDRNKNWCSFKNWCQFENTALINPCNVFCSNGKQVANKSMKKWAQEKQHCKQQQLENRYLPKPWSAPDPSRQNPNHTTISIKISKTSIFLFQSHNDIFM